MAEISKDAFTELEVLDFINSKVVPGNAISWAAENGHKELVEELIALGANICENNNYPLELACRNGHLEIAKLLLEIDADPCAGNYHALELALQKGHIEIAEMIIDKICEKRTKEKN